MSCMGKDNLFGDTEVISTRQVAVAFGISEADARAWAAELEVRKIGASFVWTRDDVAALAVQLEESGDDDDEADDDDEDETDQDESDGSQLR